MERNHPQDSGCPDDTFINSFLAALNSGKLDAAQSWFDTAKEQQVSPSVLEGMSDKLSDGYIKAADAILSYQDKTHH